MTDVKILKRPHPYSGEIFWTVVDAVTDKVASTRFSDLTDIALRRCIRQANIFNRIVNADELPEHARELVLDKPNPNTEPFDARKSYPVGSFGELTKRSSLWRLDTNTSLFGSLTIVDIEPSGKCEMCIRYTEYDEDQEEEVERAIRVDPNQSIDGDGDIIFFSNYALGKKYLDGMGKDGEWD